MLITLLTDVQALLFKPLLAVDNWRPQVIQHPSRLSIHPRHKGNTLAENASINSVDWCALWWAKIRMSWSERQLASVFYKDIQYQIENEFKKSNSTRFWIGGIWVSFMGNIINVEGRRLEGKVDIRAKPTKRRIDGPAKILSTVVSDYTLEMLELAVWFGSCWRPNMFKWRSGCWNHTWRYADEIATILGESHTFRTAVDDSILLLFTLVDVYLHFYSPNPLDGSVTRAKTDVWVCRKRFHVRHELNDSYIETIS